MLDAAVIAKQKKLNVGCWGYNDTIKIHIRELFKKYEEGMIGEIGSAQAWWNNEGVWVNKRQYNRD
ncbi:MAG: hypothetical protein U5K54_18790 [Cytophagales bacterium]|nr:hypothetical protein [Cytophagales bacterium]